MKREIPLICSSFSFMVPAIYAFHQKMYHFQFLLILTSLISANYWNHTESKWKRNLDLVFAKISFAVFFYNGMIHVRKIHFLISGYAGLVGVIYCYRSSCKLSQEKNANWYKYHFAFHCIIAYLQFIILLSMNERSLTTK
jgi:hypothetical protein